MPQRPKKEVRDTILAAAAETFAEAGFERATLGAIVQRAGTSVGNLYKYFRNKDELFAACVPRGFTADLERRIRRQVEALTGELDALALDASHPYRLASEELLRFSFAHRARIQFLLGRAEGTEYATFSDALVEMLVKLAARHARNTDPNFVMTAAKKRALVRTYRAFVATLAKIVEEERTERAFRDAVALLTTYHLSGLKAFFGASVSRSPDGKLTT